MRGRKIINPAFGAKRSVQKPKIQNGVTIDMYDANGTLSCKEIGQEIQTNQEVRHMTDTEIISLFQSRDERAVSAVSGKYGSICTGIAFNILRNRQDAEECVNDVYLKVWDSIPPERPSSLSAFIGKITRNTAIDRYRRDNSEKRGGGEVPLVLDELAECVSSGSNVEKTAEHHDLLSAINRFLDGLPADRRIAFVMRYCLCEDIKSIARRLGVTQNNVSVNLNRTRKSLASFLAKEGYEI